MSAAPHSTMYRAYERETALLVRQRLWVFAGFITAFMGFGTLVEVHVYPARTLWCVVFYLVEAVIAVVAALLTRHPPYRERPVQVGTGMAVAVTVCVCWYHALAMASAQRVVMTLGALLGVWSIILPWGVRPQLWTSAAAITGVALTIICGWTPVDDEAALIVMNVLVASAFIASMSAYLLDLYRYEAFRRTAMQTEEAEIAAGLLAVTQTLSLHLQQPNMLEQVTRHAVAALDCDCSAVFLVHSDRNAAIVGATTGLAPDVHEMLTHAEFARDALPLFQKLRPGRLTIIEDVTQQELAPPAVLQNLRIASGIWAPLGPPNRITAVLFAGYSDRTGTFSDKQQRLMHGMAHATAVALENGRLLNELEGANRLKSEFVATMSHELRTPLNIIGGYAEMLSDRVFPPESAGWNDALERIRRSTEELHDLVSATLDLNRLEAGREPVDRQPIDLASVLSGVQTDTEPLAQPGVVLRWEAELCDAGVVTDRTKLKTIVKNLVVNALKFTNQGSVTVRAIADEGALVVTVTDTGIGIPPEYLTTIFEMFRQIDGSSTRRFGGVGLGLHIVRRLAMLLGGSITVDSTLGKGSTFTLRLPGAIVAAAPITVAS